MSTAGCNTQCGIHVLYTMAVGSYSCRTADTNSLLYNTADCNGKAGRRSHTNVNLFHGDVEPVPGGVGQAEVAWFLGKLQDGVVHGQELQGYRTWKDITGNTTICTHDYDMKIHTHTVQINT